MTAGLPSGFVDPTDPVELAAILRETVDRLGMAGVVNLLAQVSGVRIEPGRPAGLLRRAEPARLHAGEARLILAAPVVREHVVGEIVLSRQPLPAGDVPYVLAGLVSAAVAAAGTSSQASVVITAFRDALTASG